MAITPADIEQQTFSPSKHGYDTEEVDAFLEQISSEVDAMLQKIADLKGRLNNTEQQLAAANAQIASLEENAGATQLAAPAPVVAPAPAPAVDLSVSERQISQVLIVAQQSADKLVAEARDNAERIRNEIQSKVAMAGIEVVEARITYLAYAPEIAAVMLQRQQASAIIDARKMMEMALERLNENQVVTLDEERKAAMVSNLLVVLCGNHDAQPVVNSGSLY